MFERNRIITSEPSSAFALGRIPVFLRPFTSGVSAPVIRSAAITRPYVDEVIGGDILGVAVDATGNPTPTLSYQWRVNGANVAGATSATFNTLAYEGLAVAITCAVTATSAQGSTTVVTPAVNTLAAWMVMSGGQPVTQNGARVYTTSGYTLQSVFPRSGQTFALGVWSGTDLASNFQTWLGAPVDFVDKHADRTSFAGCRSSITAFGSLNAAVSQQIVWSIPLVMTGGSKTLAANGGYDSEYLLTAQTTLAAHNRTTGPIFVRFDWEFNGNWQPWAAQNSTDGNLYIDKWRRAVNIYRGVSNRFKFIWCPNFGQADPDLSWPGAEYVDLIGMDLYYNAGDNAGDGTGFFSFAETTNYGLNWLRDKGAAVGRPICFPEFGVKASQGANVGEPGPATETASQAAFVSLLADWMRDNDCFYATYWDSNLDIDTKLSSGQYPLTGARFKSEYGANAIVTSGTQTIAGGDPFSVTLAANNPATWSTTSNPDGFSIAGTTLSLPAQAWASGGDNVRDVTVRATDWRGLTVDRAIALTVTAPVTDIHPTFDFAFDPAAGFYKIDSFKTNSLAAFLAHSAVSYSADPTAGIDGTGYLADETYGLYVTLPAGSNFSLYATADRPPSTSGVYHCLYNLVRSAETSTRIMGNRDGFSTNYRASARDGGGNIGTDANAGALSATADVVGMTVSGTAVKWFNAGTLQRNQATTVFATKTLDRLYIGDGIGGEVRWEARIQRVLVRYSTDSDSTAQAATA